jgi:hypothetical protein
LINQNISGPAYFGQDRVDSMRCPDNGRGKTGFAGLPPEFSAQRINA